MWFDSTGLRARGSQCMLGFFGIIDTMRFKYTTKEKMNEIPKTSGVYSFTGKQETLYIGKAANLRERVKNHFPARNASRSEAGGQQPRHGGQATFRDSLYIDKVTKIGYIETTSEIEALLLESQLIKQSLPKYNVMWKDGKKYFSVAITKEDFPRVLLTHQKQIQGKYIGPFVDGKAIKRTLRMMRRVFPYYTLRHGSGQTVHKHATRPCQYCHLGLCPGVKPDKKEYQKNIKNLVAILEGRKPVVLKKLQREMILASKNQEYEKAGKLRDQIADLEIIFSHAKILRPEEDRAPLQWKNTEAYLQQILGTKKRISRIEAYDISNTQGAEATGSMPVFIEGKPAKQCYKKFKVHITGKPNDFAMLQEVLTRRLAHKEWRYPDVMVIDGGKGQLSSVLKAFEKYTDKDAQKIYVVAIAKKHNELFLPGKSEPLLLKNMPQDVSNLILHIRDEAHRFAISYHRKLRKKELLK